MIRMTRTEDELIAQARAELDDHGVQLQGLRIAVLRENDGWGFRVSADPQTRDKPGYAEAVAMIVQIGDHLAQRYDVREEATPR